MESMEAPPKIKKKIKQELSYNPAIYQVYNQRKGNQYV